MKTWQMYTRALISAATIAASAIPGHPGSPRRCAIPCLSAAVRGLSRRGSLARLDICPLLCGVGPADPGSA